MPKLCIYITHGSLAVLKGVTRTYLKSDSDEEQIVMQYAHGKFMLLPIKEGDEGLSLEDFLASLSQKKVFRLCCDANLGAPSTDQVLGEKQQVDILVKSLQPEELVLFSNTSKCVDDANENYIPTLGNSSLKRALAIDRNQFKTIIDQGIPTICTLKNEEIDAATWVETSVSSVTPSDPVRDDAKSDDSVASEHKELLPPEDKKTTSTLIEKQGKMRQLLSALRSKFTFGKNKVFPGNNKEATNDSLSNKIDSVTKNRPRH